jgi:ketosteroid isomerase-like protein
METTPMSGSANEHEAIKNTMSSYEAALNASSTEAAMALYTEDAVFMVPNNPSAAGKTTVRQAYDIAELVVMAPQWAFVRTNSAGAQKINATGATSAEANQELFILKKDDDGKWRIARYAFSTTNPMGA